MPCNNLLTIISLSLLVVSTAHAMGELEQQRQQELAIGSLSRQVDIAELQLKLKAATEALADLDRAVPPTPDQQDTKNAPIIDALPDNELYNAPLAVPTFHADARLVEIIGDTALIEFAMRRYQVREKDQLRDYIVSTIGKNKIKLVHATTKKPLTLTFHSVPDFGNQTEQSRDVLSPLPTPTYPYPEN